MNEYRQHRRVIITTEHFDPPYWIATCAGSGAFRQGLTEHDAVHALYCYLEEREAATQTGQWTLVSFF